MVPVPASEVRGRAGEQTVKSHVSSILTKLDLRDPAQAVVYADEAGVVVSGPRH